MTEYLGAGEGEQGRGKGQWMLIREKPRRLMGLKCQPSGLVTQVSVMQGDRAVPGVVSSAVDRYRWPPFGRVSWPPI
jgi:hypothetical protein